MPKIRWELISCALHGHFLIGTDARTIRPQDEIFAREYDGLRLYRCLRCSSWVVRRPPSRPSRDVPPSRKEIDLPIRGQLLRDRYVLRLIAIDRAFHVLVFTTVATLIFIFATHEQNLHQLYEQLLQGFQGENNGIALSNTLLRFQGVFDFKAIHIYEVAAIIALLAALEAIEMIGLWQGKRWAEYLTFLATILFIPYEIYELIHGVTVIKVIALVINVAIAVYLLYAKRLFGVHGGAKGEAREKRKDSGWSYLERTSPTSR